MKIQLLAVGLLAIASASCAPGIATSVTPTASDNASSATAALTPAPADLSLKEELEGTWSAGFMTITFDWDAGTYSGVMLNEPFSKTLEFVSETGNEIIFKTNGSRIVGQFGANGEVRLIQNGDSSTALVLKRT